MQSTKRVKDESVRAKVRRNTSFWAVHHHHHRADEGLNAISPSPRVPTRPCASRGIIRLAPVIKHKVPVDPTPTAFFLRVRFWAGNTFNLPKIDG